MANIPNRIFILSDIYCRSSGDNFVQMMKQFKKVTVVGRPTLGILDYSNCCTVDYGDYRLMFPTSRCLSVDQGRGMTDKGVEPDIEIPWTPAHFERDVRSRQVFGIDSSESRNGKIRLRLDDG